MVTRTRLVVVQEDPVHRGPGGVSIATKSLLGLERYARHWPGEMVVLARAAPAELHRSPLVTTRPEADLPFTIELAEHPEQARSPRAAAVTLAMHQVRTLGLLAHEPRRVVLTGEFPLSERIRGASLGAGAPTRLRITLGWARRARALRAAVRAAGGFQANGYPAWEAYARSSASALLFFDTRVTSAVLALPPAPHRPGTSGLRIGFSGRHLPAKGPDAAVRAVLAARAAGAAVTLDLFGGGALEAELRREAAGAGDAIRFRGELPFENGWVPAVQEGIDLMMLPHRQGDPSGTYLESAALGVPVLGYANRALRPLVARHGLGWTVPLDDEAALARRVLELAADPPARERAGAAGRAFMATRSFEDEFDRRLAHLREVGGL